ncbi:hypothetical protein A2U01_0056405, partial [Trifolium medium]|nr:hypothetical protein [Trifolium medium]
MPKGRTSQLLSSSISDGNEIPSNFGRDQWTDAKCCLKYSTVALRIDDE